MGFFLFSCVILPPAKVIHLTDYECIIFDFDLTLVDLKLVESTDWMKVRKEIASYYNDKGIPASVTARQQLPVALFKEVQKTQKENFQPEDFPAIQKKASKLIEEKYERNGLKNATSIPGALDILKWIKDKGMKVGVISLNSGEIVRKAAKKAGLDEYIDIFFGRDSPGEPKPATDQLEKCLQKFGVNTEKTLMVGDSPSDIEVSNKVGLVSIALEGNFYSKEEIIRSNPDHIIKDLEELKGIVE